MGAGFLQAIGTYAAGDQPSLENREYSLASLAARITDAEKESAVTTFRNRK